MHRSITSATAFGPASAKVGVVTAVVIRYHPGAIARAFAASATSDLFVSYLQANSTGHMVINDLVLP